ncbi:MAG: 2-oxo-4-hydroxy-4-carboxy-5-ureidoimidazoline decarboxylase [Vicinamibacterales bacterium]
MERWRRIGAAAVEEAQALLRVCCGAERWVDRMMARRPFADRDTVLAAARDEWFRLRPDDWREAFSHHPPIGDREAMRARFSATRTLSEREQSGLTGASEVVLAALIEANRRYQERFGFIFIVCASGKSADQMLALLQARLDNDAATELRIATEQHAQICELRLLSDG